MLLVAQETVRLVLVELDIQVLLMELEVPG
jgi:hypothetical protein